MCCCTGAGAGSGGLLRSLALTPAFPTLFPPLPPPQGHLRGRRRGTAAALPSVSGGSRPRPCAVSGPARMRQGDLRKRGVPEMLARVPGKRRARDGKDRRLVAHEGVFFFFGPIGAKFLGPALLPETGPLPSPD